MGLGNIYNDWLKGLHDKAIIEITILKNEYSDIEKYGADEIKLYHYVCDKLILLSDKNNDNNFEREVLLDYLFLKIHFFRTT